MRPIDAVLLTEGIELHRQSTDQTCEMDRQWAIGYNAGLDRALYSIAYAKTITPPPNDPLTLEELREMAPHEWCWIERKMKPGYYCKFRRYTNEKSFSCGWPGSDIFIFDYEDYGKDWLAYPWLSVCPRFV